MRALQLALLLLSIQFGLGFMAVFGSFGYIPYETKMTGINLTGGAVQTELEQQQLSINIMNAIWNILVWDWIKNFFIPWYYSDSGVKSIVDFVIFMLRSLTGIILGAAFIEFIRNRIDVLR